MFKDRFLASGINDRFFTNATNYQHYIEHCVEMIRNTRVDLQCLPSFDRIHLNSPNQYLNSARKEMGILLIHGLFDSCASMQSLFDYFKEKAYPVKNLLLPGHGTRPGDLLHVTYQEWVEAGKFAIKCLQQECQQICVIGLSTGAALAVHLLQLGEKIDKMVLFAPAFAIKNKTSKLAGLVHYSSYLIPRLKWVSQSQDDDAGKYQSVTINAIYQLNLLIKRLNLQPNKIKIPLFFILSEDDETISTPFAIDCFNTQYNPHSRLILYSKCPLTHQDPRVTIKPSTYPKERILDFSHACMTVAPNHFYYGKNGMYRDFNHYQYHPTKMASHNKTTLPYYGAVNIKNMRLHVLERLRYNPDFKEMMESISQFIS